MSLKPPRCMLTPRQQRGVFGDSERAQWPSLSKAAAFTASVPENPLLTEGRAFGVRRRGGGGAGER